MKFLIVSGGEPAREDIIKNESIGSKIICADKGLEYLDKYNIKPDFIVGDFDSLDNNILDKYKNLNIKINKYNTEKNFTDTEIALDTAIENGANEISIICATGQRLDHTFSNISLLKKAKLRGVKARIIDNYSNILFYNESFELPKENWKYFSIYAYGEVVENINIIYAKYPLSKYRLQPFDGLTVSNEFLDRSVQVKFNSGEVILFLIH